MASSTNKQSPRYAEGTKVPVEKSHIAVQKILKQYGASNSAYGEQGDTAAIVFTMKGRQYRIQIAYPPLSDFEYAGKVKRTLAQMRAAREQETRRLWRALYMVVKAKLEAAQSGIVTFEQEFLAHTVLRNNQTVDEWIEPQLETGKVPLLPETSSVGWDEIPDIIIDGEIIE